MRKLVLFIEWRSQGRDFEIDLPLMYFFEKVLNWDTAYESIFNLPKILSYKPDMIIMSNTTGGSINYDMSKMIKDSGIPFFSHVSEGMFREEHLDNGLWGWNHKKQFNEIYSMLWSKRSYDLSLSKYPYLENTIKVSGSLGHDKYSIFRRKKKKNKSIQIGYACFDFNNMSANKEKFYKSLSKERIDYILNSIPMVNQLLENILKSNKNVELVAKPHPGDGQKTPLELKGLFEYENFRVVPNDVSIISVIDEVDLWISFNSSTNLEAWLLDKPTIVFATNDLIRSSSVIDGSIRENDFNKIQKYIEEFIQDKQIIDFEKKKDLRQKLIKELIGYNDGLNHVRFMSFLKQYIEKIENDELEKREWNIPLQRKIKDSIKHYIYCIAKNRYKIPFLKKWAHIYGHFNIEDIEKQKNNRYPDYDSFYKDNDSEIQNIYNNYSKEWLK